MTEPHSEALSYRAAGVDIDAGNALVERIKPFAARTQRPEQLGGLGGFGGLFAVPMERFRQPVLVAGTDGVGTKLKLAFTHARHHTVGIDLVAMSVNDVLVQGAEPLFFLDYYATGRLDVDSAAQVIEGIADGCLEAGCALLGGETAEMPGMYPPGEYDLAGFCVGVVERDALITGRTCQRGDSLIALPSSGPHANGFSLIRAILDRAQPDLGQRCGEISLGDALLAPTRIYVRPVLRLLREVTVHALAHITGGGLPENLPRVFPSTLAAEIELDSWTLPPVFQWLQQQGDLPRQELFRTFNCGVGMVLIIPATATETALALLRAAGERPWVLGRLVDRDAGDAVRLRGD